MQNLIAIVSGASAPKIRDFACRWGDYSLLFAFGFFNKATAYTPGRILTQNTSNDAVPGKEVPFWGSCRGVARIFGLGGQTVPCRAEPDPAITEVVKSMRGVWVLPQKKFADPNT